MLITPYLDPNRWEKIEGETNCVGKDIYVDSIEMIENEIVAEWTKDTRAFPWVRTVPTEHDMWYLYAGQGYIVTLSPITIPEDCFGILKPRSTLLKMGVMVSSTAVWDPGYSGKGKVLIKPCTNIQLGTDVPMFSLQLYRAEGMKLYDGFYKA